MSRATKRSASSVDSDDAAQPSPPSRKPALAPRRSGFGGAAPPRSCERCHRRKVRCDRTVPCNNCSRHGMTCVYPEKDDESSAKAPSLRDISDRLERLETILLTRLSERSEAVTFAAAEDDGSHYHRRRSHAESAIPAEPSSGAKVQSAGKHGRPVSKKNQITSTWELLLNSSDVEPLLHDHCQEPVPSGAAAPQPAANGPAYSNGSTQPGIVSVSQEGDSHPTVFYPDTQVALRLWDVYVKSVDPVVKILHIPTMQSTIVATILDPASATPSTLVLTVAIYFAALTALCHDETEETVDLPKEKSVLLKRCQTTLDKLLMTPEVMDRPQLATLQAFAIYVTCLRAHELGRRVWVLTGLAIRLAQSIGLHRNVPSLRLSPFESEMRSRLWWQLCILDARAPEDQGLQPTLDLVNQELRRPLNVNDNQLYPDMPSLPKESRVWTEMSFFLIQTDSCRLVHPMLHHPEGLVDDEGKRIRLQRPMIYLSDNFGLSPDSPPPTRLARLAAQHVLTACKKMEFVLRLREEVILRKQQGERALNGTTLEEALKLSFTLACDALETSHTLVNEGMAGGLQWFFNMYTQWYALSYVLRSLRGGVSSPDGRDTARTLALVDALVHRATKHHRQAATFHGGQYPGRIWGLLESFRRQASSSRQKDASSVAAADGQTQMPSRKKDHSWHVHPNNADIQPPAHPGMGDEEMPIISDWMGEFISDSDQASSLDLLVPDISFLPDWNAIINGS